MIHGYRFDSIVATATVLGVPYQSLHKTIRTAMTPKKSDRLLHLVMEWQAKESPRKKAA